MKYYAIIVAGGSGNRMQTETPKQFLLLQNLPVVMHTINAFALSNTKPNIFLVLNPSQHEHWKNLCIQYNFNIPHTLVSGGIERYHSVKNALDQISGEGVISIHDAVRPLISKEIIDISFKKAQMEGNAVVAVKPTDSIRKIKGNYTEAVKREEYILVQTPQVFTAGVIQKAYTFPYDKSFTDDASVAEHSGVFINILEGDRNNIKITYPADLIFAEYLLSK